MNLEESLRALALEDEAAGVPPRVDAAVMAAWDANRQGARPMETTPRRQWVAWTVAAAATVVAAALLTWRPAVETQPQGAAAPIPLVTNELVLVPEPFGGGPLMLMRVRMTRREFSRLGVPISNPDGNGLVDVEVLVGEDGVARSIRRAVAVGSTERNP